MKKAYINKLIEDNKTITGYTVLNKSVRKSLAEIFNADLLSDIMLRAKNLRNEGSLYTIVRFGQYIAFLQLSAQPFDGMINFIDCKNDAETALRIFNEYAEDGWEEETEESFMKIFREIETDRDSEKAELILENELHEDVL